jgi:hypothetical protein
MPDISTGLLPPLIIISVMEIQSSISKGARGIGSTEKV